MPTRSVEDIDRDIAQQHAILATPTPQQRLDALEQERAETQRQGAARARRTVALIELLQPRVAAYKTAIDRARAELSQKNVNAVMAAYREASALCSDVYGMTGSYRHHAMSLPIPARALGEGAQRFLILSPKHRVERTWVHLLDEELR